MTTDASTEQHVRTLVHAHLPDPLASLVSQGAGFPALVAKLVALAGTDHDELETTLTGVTDPLTSGQISWMTHRAEAPAAFLASRLPDAEDTADEVDWRQRAEDAEARLRDDRGPASRLDTVVILRMAGTSDGDAQRARIDRHVQEVTGSSSRHTVDAVLDALLAEGGKAGGRR